MNANPNPNQPTDDDACSGAADAQRPGAVADPDIPDFIGKPDRIDKLMWAYMVIATVFSFAMMPLRVWLLNHPIAYALMVGGYTSSIVGGAQSTEGGTPAALIVAFTLVGALKAVPLWWLIGRKWGQEYLRMSVANSRRLQRWAVRLQDAKPATLAAAIVLSYIPFVPTIVIANLLAGIRRMGFWFVMGLNAAGVLATNAFFAYLGVRYGEQVISVVEQVNTYALWITVVLLVVMVWSATKQSKKR